MGLFSKRPLAIFCFLFLFVSLLAFLYPMLYSALTFIIVGTVALGFFVLSFFVKKFHVKLVTLCICFVVILSALFHSFLSVGLQKERAKEYVGERRVHCRIIDDEYMTENISLYHVRIKNIDGNDVNIKATLMFAFDADVAPGDEIYAIADVELNDNSYSKSDGNILALNIKYSDSCYAKYLSRNESNISLLFSDGGARIISDRIGDRIGNTLAKGLGDEMGKLSLGFFTGIRENISSDVTRDFRRAGVSHIMAVSGSHIAILLGGIEMLLRKLRIKKQIRCITVAVCGIAFMFITGFSLSGCRSVLMLYAVYLGFLFSEDNDPITSLFVSISLIVLISPYSIADLGMWMSFIATLGLLTAYPVFEERIAYPRKKKGIVKGLLLVCRDMLLMVIMTVVANAYLLPISWYFFGEFSVVSILANILIGWISSLFMILILIFLLLCNIPILSLILAKTVTAVGKVILFLVRFCARIPNATVSLKYEFCKVIMILFIISMIVLLGINLKHKSLIAIPFLAAVISFAACLSVTNIFFSKPRLEYIVQGTDNEIIAVNEKDSISFFHVSNSNGLFSSAVIDKMKDSPATEIENIILTEHSGSHVKSIDIITGRFMVRNIYLPIPEDEQSKYFASKIYWIASKNGASVYFYSDGEILNVTKNVKFNAYRHKDGVSLGFYGRDVTVGYTTPCHTDLGVNFDTLIIGGGCTEHDFKHVLGTNAKKIILSSRNIAEKIKFSNSDNIFLAKKGRIYREAEIGLSK